MSAPRAKGYNSRSQGIQSHVLPHAGALTERATRYFGIDLARLPQMSDRELAQFADRATAMTRLKEILPILEKHFTTLIEGQVEYEQFTQRVLKQVEKGSKQIDKSLLDAWLLSKGYDKHLQSMNQRAGHGIQKLETEHRSEQDLNRLDFQAAIKMIHLRHQNRAKAIGEKVPQAKRQMQVQETLRRQGETRKELLTYGTAGKPGKGLWQGVKSFFGG
ncbi:hypothetical protein H6F86_02050 [Phormidium sp. FACHB-592]|uniref:Uncharacterized protein n=1 Tax=Stenomitos frigidus AS-A4 TaxID=2933935 RepID=A0ABV0KJQ4_9CYAN|nr:hypothetical protein [Phormidium sp. FACHB-592]MBD2072689.1 hypothetical protein [Phormidium sp. FACHB-592]